MRKRQIGGEKGSWGAKRTALRPLPKKWLPLVFFTRSDAPKGAWGCQGELDGRRRAGPGTAKFFKHLRPFSRVRGVYLDAWAELCRSGKSFATGCKKSDRKISQQQREENIDLERPKERRNFLRGD